ncbi:hypothetical protein EfsSVR2281_16170 [Enterococcus faecalis]|nr:hypothetical protein EfsSVR2281_16170 [Enterococcus faecalis]
MLGIRTVKTKTTNKESRTDGRGAIEPIMIDFDNFERVKLEDVAEFEGQKQDTFILPNINHSNIGYERPNRFSRIS